MLIKDGILFGDDGKTPYMCPFEPSQLISSQIAGGAQYLRKVIPCNAMCDLGFELIKEENKEKQVVDMACLHCVKRKFPVTVVSLKPQQTRKQFD